jgi:hypothetical protein
VALQLENSWFSIFGDADSPTKKLVGSLLKDVFSEDKSQVVDLWD